jgi:hypothetical protein
VLKPAYNIVSGFKHVRKMAYTEELMFDYIKNLNETEIVTYPMCVNSFKNFEKGSQAREVLVNLACKILVAVYTTSENHLSMTDDEVAKMVVATIAYK